MYTRGNMLIKKFKKCIFTIFCNNVYGGHLWTLYRSQALKKVTVAFNEITFYQNVFSVEGGASMSTIYVHNNADSFKLLLRKAAYRFRLHMVESTNKYIITYFKVSVFLQ